MGQTKYQGIEMKGIGWLILEPWIDVGDLASPRTATRAILNRFLMTMDRHACIIFCNFRWQESRISRNKS